MILLAISSCISAPTIKEPLQTYQVNFRFEKISVKRVNYNYKDKKSEVAEAIEDPYKINFNQAPENLFCFSLETYLTKIKPKIKEGSEAYHDNNPKIKEGSEAYHDNNPKKIMDKSLSSSDSNRPP